MLEQQAGKVTLANQIYPYKGYTEWYGLRCFDCYIYVVCLIRDRSQGLLRRRQPADGERDGALRQHVGDQGTLQTVRWHTDLFHQ
jgi:hypothetical protein